MGREKTQSTEEPGPVTTPTSKVLSGLLLMETHFEWVFSSVSTQNQGLHGVSGRIFYPQNRDALVRLLHFWRLTPRPDVWTGTDQFAVWFAPQSACNLRRSCSERCESCQSNFNLSNSPLTLARSENTKEPGFCFFFFFFLRPVGQNASHVCPFYPWLPFDYV